MRVGRDIAIAAESPYKISMTGFRTQDTTASGALRDRRQNHAGGAPRAATAKNRVAIEALLRESGLPTAGVAENLEHFFVYEGDDGIVLGAAGVELYGNAGLLRSVAVAASVRRRGIAAALIGRAASRARSEGCDALYLLTLDAQRYFERFGFTVIDRDEAPAAIRGSREFATLCPASAVLMRRRLRT